jgi:two-component system, OmpR family, KDP operon response regulator KdpE
VARPLVLLVDADPLLRRVLIVALRSHGYEVKPAATGSQALHEIGSRTPDAMILDPALTDMDGFDFLASVRQGYELPIIILSARGDEQHQIRALDGGANDHVTKPFREGELMARLRAALRRPVPLSERREISVGDLRIDALQRRVFVGDIEVTLTPTEFKLLHVLARQSDQVLTHRQLLRQVWGGARVLEVQYLRVYMKQLRQKIEADPSRPARIVTALGVGYQLVGAEPAM